MEKSCKISTKRKSPTPWLSFSQLPLCPLPDISLVTYSRTIMIISSPNFVPWGTPARTIPHSERQSWKSLTRCLREVRKAEIQEMTGSGMSFVLSFLTNIWWSMGSKAAKSFLKVKENHPSVALFQAWIILTRVSVVLEPDRGQTALDQP